MSPRNRSFSAHAVTLLLVACTAELAPDPDAGSDAESHDAPETDACDEDAGPRQFLTFAEVPGTSPPARWGHVAGYDAKRSRMVVFGGTGAAGRLDDVWELSDGWKEIATEGGPSGRFTSGAVMDPLRDRWVVMSGDDGNAQDDVWALALDSHVWTEMAKGPSARFDVGSTTAGRKAWFFAGFAEGFIPLNDLWELDLDTDAWRELPTGEVRPTRRTNLAMAEHDGYLYVIGGHDDEVLTKDYWRYGIATEHWEPVDGPTSLSGWAHFAYARGPHAELWMFGADNNDYVEVDTTWRVTLGSPIVIEEIPRTPESSVVAPRRHATLVFGPELIVYGGAAGKKGVLGDTHRGTLASRPPCD